jgi:hypothetical protein
MKIFSREFRYKNTYFEMQVKTLIAEKRMFLFMQENPKCRKNIQNN